MTTTNTRPAVLTETQIAAIDALSRVSALDPHLTRAQRHDIHVLTAQIAGLPHPTCCA